MRRRLAALALGVALAAALWFGVADRLVRHGSAPARDRAAVRRLLDERARGAAHATDDPLERELYLPEDVARTLFSVQATAQVYDPWCYHVHRPGLDVEVAWEEHPAGRWRYRTNAQGWREDADHREGPVDLRVLVTGDSHAEGFCDNADAFPNRLEAALRARHPGRSIDVINAADGGYSFHNYLGVLEKHLDLAPDVFVVCVHAGNDFKDVLLPARWFARLPLTEPTAEEVAERKRCEALDSSANTQALASLLWFRRHPEDAALALDTALELLLRARELCRSEGIELIVLLLPSPLDMDAAARAGRIRSLREAFALSDAELDLNRELGRRLLAALSERGVTTLDLAPALPPEDGPWTWNRDLHLNLRGHAAVARALEPLIDADERLAAPR